MSSTDWPITEAPGQDVQAVIPADIRLASGDALDATIVNGRIHGRQGAPLVVVAGGISADRHAARWWSWLVRPGGPVDLDRVRVLAFDYLPGKTEAAVTITSQDQARLLALLLDALNETTVDAFIGASYGACVGLAFAETYPERIGQLVAISGAHRAHPAATAWRGIQRRILAFARECGREAEGIALARELAMTTYRTADEFDTRFSRRAPEQAGDPYPVCDYLISRGEGYDAVTTADRWISLSDSLDRQSVDPARVTCPLTVVAFTSDRLVPVEDSRELADLAPSARLIEASSIFGHDAFLKEREVVGRAVSEALTPLFQPSLNRLNTAQEIAA